MLCNSCHSRNFISYCLKQVGRGKEDTPELDKNPGISDPGELTLDHFKSVVLNMFQKLLSLSCVVKYSVTTKVDFCPLAGAKPLAYQNSKPLAKGKPLVSRPDLWLAGRTFG